MSDFTVTVKMTRPQLAEVLRRLPGVISGRLADPLGGTGHRRVMTAAAMQLMSLVRESFKTKSEGGTGEDGIKWAPLAQATIDRRLRKAGLPGQKAMRRELEQAYARLAQTGQGQVLLERAKKNLERAKKKALKVFGASFPIGIDTKRMFASLSPGVGGVAAKPQSIPEAAARGQTPEIPGTDDVLRIGRGFAIVGTRAATDGGFHYPAAFHGGTKFQPERPLWPGEPDAIPERWYEMMGDAVAGATVYLLIKWLEQGGR